MLQRMRQRRLLLRFSQSELAGDLGLNRSAMANYENGRLALPFNIGLALCRRLRLNPAFIVFGEPPESPYIELAELGLVESEVIAKAGRSSFPEAFEVFLRRPLADFFARHTLDELVLREIRSGHESGVINASMAELERMLSEISEGAETWSASQKVAHLQVIAALANELARRLSMSAGKRGRSRGKNRDGAVAAKNSVDDGTQWVLAGAVKIAKQLRQTRERLGLSQSRAAEQWKVPLSTLKKWEQGTRTPRGLGLRQLETILRTAGQPNG